MKLYLSSPVGNTSSAAARASHQDICVYHWKDCIHLHIFKWGLQMFSYSLILVSSDSAVLQMGIQMSSSDWEEYHTFQWSCHCQSYTDIPRRLRAKCWNFILEWNNLETFSKPQNTGYGVNSLPRHWIHISYLSHPHPTQMLTKSVENNKLSKPEFSLLVRSTLVDQASHRRAVVNILSKRTFTCYFWFSCSIKELSGALTGRAFSELCCQTSEV